MVKLVYTQRSGRCGSNPVEVRVLFSAHMQIRIEKITENPVNILRRLGYAFQRHEGDQMSFVRPLARAGFPRFHIYAKISGSDLIVSIHLDQKRETYGNDTRHHGEYENDGALKDEVERIKSIVN